MRKLMTSIGITAVIAAFSTSVAAGSWMLIPEGSKIAFGSVKKDSVGETHHFERLSGSVSEAGDVDITIDLTSVQTWIDIRNERILDHVFGDTASASLKASVDVQALETMAVGDTMSLDVSVTLSFLGNELPVETDMFAARLSDNKVLVTTDELIWIRADEAGLTAGVDKLMELAKLPSITRAIPVTARLMFESDNAADGGEVAPVEEVALAGDPKKGKRVFKKCKACHKLEVGKNGVGPSLAGILGKPAGSVEGYDYSPAMAESGLTWDVETITAYIAKPKAVVPKTKMTFAGIKKDKDIENLLAYLAAEAQ